MALGNAKIHLSESNQREVPLGQYPYRLSVPCRDILKEELLLIHSCRGKKSCFHTLPEPALRKVVGIADLLHTFNLVRNALSLTVADGYVRLDDLSGFKDIRSWHLGVGETYPAVVLCTPLHYDVNNQSLPHAEVFKDIS